MAEADSECLFCKIVKGKIVANKKEHEDDACVVIHDIHPQAPLHLLIIGKRHGVELAVVDDDHLGAMLKVAKKMIEEKNMGFSYRLTINGGRATMVSNHLHIHLLGGVNSERSI